MRAIPTLRLRVLNDRPPKADGALVVYWMTTARRTRWSFALQQAVGWARELKRPLLIVEILACGGRWDSERHHSFVLQGMRENAQQLADAPVLYYPYVEPQPGECRKLFAAVSDQACLVVTDDYPIALPAVQTVVAEVPVRVEKIDGSGLMPLRAADQAFPTAYAFRRFLQRALREHLLDAPQPDPLARAALPRLKSLPATIRRRWPDASPQLLACEPTALAVLPIDHSVCMVSTACGSAAARARWKTFLSKKLASYNEARNQPEAEATSGLAPYLHFGNISPHEMFRSLAQQEGWSPAELADKAAGSRAGWWGMSESAEAFLDQLVTWRELGFNGCAHREDYDQFSSLPPWATATLTKHAADDRSYAYTLEEFASARTHDPLWNAAQRQLIAEGHIHNYLRMLWGKKILQWTAAPQEALDIMVELNNRYALDGQDPNSYSGIFWILGRYDRPWGPERPIFGTVRYMSSENTARKLRVGDYMQRYSTETTG
ncbi:MAG: deoxyribodipyrimidine photolyase [Rhodopirellula sp.]|nr:deoxyribodipyrimidine photolyase [Rhodopirellula sp.]